MTERVKKAEVSGVGETSSMSTDGDGMKVGHDSESIWVTVDSALTLATVLGGLGMPEYPKEVSIEGGVDVVPVVLPPYHKESETKEAKEHPRNEGTLARSQRTAEVERRGKQKRAARMEIGTRCRKESPSNSTTGNHPRWQMKNIG